MFNEIICSQVNANVYCVENFFRLIYHFKLLSSRYKAYTYLKLLILYDIDTMSTLYYYLKFIKI